jgi:beta-glucosidase
MKRLKYLILFINLNITFTAFAQFPIILEAESAKLYGSLKASSTTGFSEDKYVNDFLISTDSYLLFENVQIDQAGTYELRVFSTGSSRPFSIKVNKYARTIHWTKDSPNWNSPPTTMSSTLIYLDKGLNTIKLASENENGPNLDKFEIHRTSTVISKPETVKSVFQYDFTDESVITAEHNNNSLENLTDNDEDTYYEVSGVTSTTITVDCKENKVLTSILLAAEKGVDPRLWKIEYSTDANTWKRLTYTSSKTIGMGDLTLLTYDRTSANAATFAARYYRLTATGTTDIKIYEWQLFGFPFLSTNGVNFPIDITSVTNLSERISGYPAGKPNEALINLFDKRLSTKYCADGTRFYVQYVLDKAYKFTSYTITSANDYSERDPKLWSFSGYDPEEGWIELDEQRSFFFPSRYATMKFKINSDKEFTAFMLEVSSIKSGNLVQLGKIQVFGEATGNPSVSPVTPGNTGLNAKERAAELVKSMTKSEKLSYVGGVDWMFTKPIPRLGIPRMKMSDGPQGLGTWGQSTAYPVAILLAATWNENLAKSYGHALAMDCKARGVNILLGPGVNIHRAPMCGRNFEYMGEDPYLTSRTAVGYIKGLQENGVMGVVKHFAANYQEFDRNYVSSDIDERTLHEIYFPAFKASVQEAKVGSVMTSYNLLNGEWTTHSPWLLTNVLREQWGFDGFVMSDWGSTHACLPAANAGLDLEMAGGEKMNPDSLRYYINKGDLQMSTIDRKVQHTLQTMIEFGFMDNNQLDNTIPLDNPGSVQTALDVAREGIVLLKNQDNILPLNANATKNIVVVGKNASRFTTGGGSGRVDPFHFVSFLDGIKNIGNQKGINVKYIDEYDHIDNVVYTAANSETKGFTGQYFNNNNLQGTPAGTRIDKKIDFNFQSGTGVSGIGTSNYSIRWTGEIRPEDTGEYTITLGGDDGFRLYINDALVINDWNPGQERYKTYKYNFVAGNKYGIKVEYFQGGGAASVDMYWIKTGAADYFLTALDNADMVIACFGHDASSEAEGGDRTFELPASQQNLINKVTRTKTPVVGVVTAGGNVEMQTWESKLKGLLWAWYPGQEGGTALAEILFGDVNPSGKLPVTFEKRWIDNPTYNSYYDSNGDKRVSFTEGIFMGYRGYDKLNRLVQYPFGHGLSYTTFNLSEMTVEETTENNSIVKVSARLVNTGNVAGAQVVQLYVGKTEASPVERPLKELKSFKKIYLAPGESETITMYLEKDAFSYYDVVTKKFVLDKGQYEIGIGFSSKEIKLKQNIDVNPGNTSVKKASKNSSKLTPNIVNKGELIKIGAGKASKVNVYDVSGALKSFYKNTEYIPTCGLIQGIYVAHIDIENTLMKGKFIVK